VFDFTGLQRPENLIPVLDPATAPLVGTEIGFYDSQSGDTRGGDDAWSSYWYNNFIYVNGGLGSRDIRGDRVYDVHPHGLEMVLRPLPFPPVVGEEIAGIMSLREGRSWREIVGEEEPHEPRIRRG
jgi:hypothetical protein